MPASDEYISLPALAEHGEPSVDEAWHVQGRVYQAARDPERLQMEQRAEALLAAGYPVELNDDAGIPAEQRLKEARAAAGSAQRGCVSEIIPTGLSAREICQVLREVTFERRVR